MEEGERLRRELEQSLASKRREQLARLENMSLENKSMQEQFDRQLRETTALYQVKIKEAEARAQARALQRQREEMDRIQRLEEQHLAQLRKAREENQLLALEIAKAKEEKTREEERQLREREREREREVARVEAELRAKEQELTSLQLEAGRLHRERERVRLEQLSRASLGGSGLRMYPYTLL